MILKIFVTLLILLSGQLAAGEKEIIPTKLPYDVGDTLPDTIILDEENAIAFLPTVLSCTFFRLYPATIDDIQYYYCFGQGFNPDRDSIRVIWQITVKDTTFVTLEGLKVGQPFIDALPFSKGEIIQVYIAWKVYARLPSGWEATYSVGSFRDSDSDFSGKKDSIPITERKIEYFLKTGYSGEPDDEYKLRYLKKIEGYDINPDDS